jgi:tetratricopeptide (TPR) repeat protein
MQGALAALLLSGCASHQLDPNLVAATDVGRYGGARVALQKSLSDDPADRAYILGRLRLLILTLADGVPAAAEEVANQTFRLLRTQGLNADRTTAAVVFNEGVKIWKGEPFEQALGYTYIAIQKAQLGQWDNARAAAGASLFLLKDFGDNERGREMSSIEVARRAAEEDARRGEGAGDRYINRGYTPIKTNFVLGYLLAALSNKALGREDEASDNFNEAIVVNPGLTPLVEQLQGGGYNTVFVVDYGRGPTKVATGPDNAFARFMPNTASDGRGIVAAVSGGEAASAQAPPVQDINRMAASLAWNNLEDVRQAKSLLGTGLLVGGLATAGTARDRDGRTHQNQAFIGAGLALTGLLMKATAHADTRHAEFLPQRVYLVPVDIRSRDAVVTLEVEGDPSSRIVLAAVDPPPEGGPFQLRYVRMNPRSSPAWATSGAVLYGNDGYGGRVEGDTLPYILGGRDVSLPTVDAMERYRGAGNLADMTASELENLYREEGIALSVEDQQGRSRKHVLEGGDSLVAPLPGTAGYARLFGQLHPPYQPKGQAVRELAEKIRGSGN